MSYFKKLTSKSMLHIRLLQNACVEKSLQKADRPLCFKKRLQNEMKQNYNLFFTTSLLQICNDSTSTTVHSVMRSALVSKESFPCTASTAIPVWATKIVSLNMVAKRSAIFL